ncbi:MAG: hypothetical protein JSR82_04725 [Verrucomicrobia bacterium]|nr:hypothetical protein [Verrucomicrobiota bacterium]
MPDPLGFDSRKGGNSLRLLLVVGLLHLFASVLPGAVRPTPSVAILPFAAPGASEETVFFASSVVEEMQVALGRSSALNVIGQQSVVRYAGGAWDVRRVAQELQATHLVRGRLESRDEQVELEIELVDGATGAILWSNRLVRPAADLFKLQQVLTDLLARQLEVEMSGPDRPPADAPTPRREAYEYYLRANFAHRAALLAGRAKTGPKDARIEEIELLQKAVELDPDFYLAHCALARACHRLPWERWDRQDPRRRAGAVSLARAGALRPAGGEYLLERARYACWSASAYALARPDLVAAERLLPNSADVFALRSLVERKLGCWEEAEYALERALRLDPNVIRYARQAALMAEHRRHYARAFELRRRICERWPGDELDAALLARLEFYVTGDPAPLVRLLRRSLARPRVRPEVAGLALLAARWSGDAALGRRALQQLPPAGFVSPNLMSFPRSWCALLLAELQDAATAEQRQAAAEELFSLLQERPTDPLLLGSLGLVLAGQGRLDEAAGLAERAVWLQSKVDDAVDGPDASTLQAAILAASGREAEAVAILTRLAARPAFLLHRGLLLRDPWWRRLQGRADFASLLEVLSRSALPPLDLLP